MGLALALTSSIEAIGSEFKYHKLEGEMLKRFDYGNESVFFMRFHAGTFLGEEQLIPDEDETLETFDKFSIPRYELFKLGGRDLLKGVDEVRGTDELRVTGEYFYPVFRNREYRKLGARISDLFLIGYRRGRRDRPISPTSGFSTPAGVRDGAADPQLQSSSPRFTPPRREAGWMEGREFLVAARTSR
jgi:hypothetical protein